jgi:hypothetical protein
LIGGVLRQEIPGGMSYRGQQYQYEGEGGHVIEYSTCGWNYECESVFPFLNSPWWHFSRICLLYSQHLSQDTLGAEDTIGYGCCSAS